jgi:hypothetical protein
MSAYEVVGVQMWYDEAFAAAGRGSILWDLDRMMARKDEDPNLSGSQSVAYFS